MDPALHRLDQQRRRSRALDRSRGDRHRRLPSSVDVPRWSSDQCHGEGEGREDGEDIGAQRIGGGSGGRERVEGGGGEEGVEHREDPDVLDRGGRGGDGRGSGEGVQSGDGC